MKAGKYSVKELFINRYVQQIIIPEIQRDYVWGENQVLGLLNSIVGDFNYYKNAQVPTITTTDEELTKAFEFFYKQRNNGANIGFIYAYSDEQYSGKYFLIDGQQRITTIFLMLLALAYQDDNVRDKFEKTYFNEKVLKLDYKVRESAHQFLSAFVMQVLKKDINIEDKSWYFSNKYDSDTTIKSLINNFHSINLYIEKHLSQDSLSFYNYLEDFVEFWYFDTNISEQGEELYIYMNARGEQMQSNENLKADLLSELTSDYEKNKYGKLWEDWQDFFWRFKGENENADIGFNSFLNWCQLLFTIESRFNNNEDLKAEEIDSFADVVRGKEKINLNLIKLNIKDLELYFESVKFYFEEYLERSKENELYSKFIDTKWLSGNLSQIDQFRLLPFIYFIKKHQLFSLKDFDLTQLFRLNRLLFNLRLDETVGKTAATQTIYGIKLFNELKIDFQFEDLLNFEHGYKSILNNEEIQKIEVIKTIQELETKYKTSLIFGKIEDHKIIKGKILFLIDLSKELNQGIFSYDSFLALWLKYQDFLENEGRFKAELLNSNSFIQIGNRVKLEDDWFKKDQVLNELKIYYSFQGNYELFLDEKHKFFLGQYLSIEDLKKEELPKKQLYITYLFSRKLGLDWNWEKGKNFGVYYNGQDFNSFFYKKMVFQHYDRQWHDNEWRVIDIQKEEIEDKDLIKILGII